MTDHVLQAGRTLARQYMTDLCTITRPGARAFDQATGDYVAGSISVTTWDGTQAWDGPQTWDGQVVTNADGTTTVYSGPCRLVTRSLGDTEAGDAEAEQRRLQVWIPDNAATVIRKGDVVTADSDPWLAASLRVAHVDTQTHRAYRLLECEVLP